MCNFDYLLKRSFEERAQLLCVLVDPIKFFRYI